MATRTRYDTEVKAGDTFRRNFVLVGPNGQSIDLEDCEARMHLRTSTDAEEPSLEMSSDDDSIVIEVSDSEADRIKLYISDTDTSALGGTVSISYKYDLEIVWPSGDVTSPLYGKIKVTPEITREA